MKTNKLNILLPTDFSDNAWSAVIYALQLYANEHCTFYLLHSSFITAADNRTYITTHYVDKQRKISERKLIELKVQTQMANANANHDFKTLLSEEELKIAVQNAVKDYSIDMVVMGTKGTTDALEFMMGSNTVKVIKKIKDCPVLIVPDAYKYMEPKQIAFPTDYNRFYDGPELRPLMDMADLFSSKISVVHINVENKLSEIQEYNMNMLKSYLVDHEYSLHWLPDYTNKSKAIATFIEELGIDMLVMINYKHGFFESILNEPVIKKLAFHPTVPILVITE